MKPFIFLGCLLGSVSMLCFATGQQEHKDQKGGPKRGDEAGYKSELLSDKNMVPVVIEAKETDHLEQKKHSMDNKVNEHAEINPQYNITSKDEGLEEPDVIPESNNGLSTSPSEMDKGNEQEKPPSESSKNTVPFLAEGIGNVEIQENSKENLFEESSPPKSQIEAPDGKQLTDCDPKTRPTSGHSISAGVARQKAKVGEPLECEVKQAVATDQRIPNSNEALLEDGSQGAIDESKIQAAFQNTSKETNQSSISEGITQEEENAAQPLTEEQTPPTPPTTPPCPTAWPKCPNDRLVNALSDVSKDLMTWALKLFSQLSSSDTRPNVVVAPISVSLALSHLMLGAGGETRQLMLSKLYNEHTDANCIHRAIKNLTKLDSFISASNIFFKKDLNVSEDFINQSLRFYGSRVEHLDSDEKKSLKKINAWVSQKTQNLIPTLLQELPHDLQMMLANVIFYKGKWLSMFDPRNTKEENFHHPPSNSAKVQMMNAHKYPLQSTSDAHLQAQVARFPLSDDCSLLIFLPQSPKPDALPTMLKKLNQEVVNTIITQLEERLMKATFVSLPHLKLDSNFQLNNAIGDLGLEELFESPNLCALSNERLVVSEIHHRAVLEVKEEGVKAAAASTISAGRSASVFAVKRPFLFILVSDKSRIPILIGRVRDPSK